MTLRLADYLPYLLNRAGSRIATAFTGVVRRRDLTLAMWRVLAALQEEELLKVSELAERTSIEISTLSRILDALEQRNLVQRRRDARERRVVRVRPTAKAHRLTAELVPTALAYERAALKGFSDDEVARLKDYLRRLHRNMADLEKLAPDSDNPHHDAAE